MASSRSRLVVGVLALAAASGLSADRIVAAGPNGERTISFYHIHTQERITVTYKKAGSYVPEALKQINWIMRDWRKNQATPIDPATIDLAWEMHQELGSREPISIICGFRSRDTNEKLRRNVGGQASQSQHITGKAIDITFPDVPLKRMRYSALIRERGGVGYYPTSGIPFVHVDTARVRSWPRLPRYELALVFPEGHSRHMPADGGPITPADVRVAQSKYRDLAVQVAAFHDSRRSLNAPTLLASAAPASTPAKPVTVAADATRAPRYAVASLDAGLPWAAKSETARKIDLKAEPLDGDAVARRGQPDTTRQVASLGSTQIASLTPAMKSQMPKLTSEPKLVDRPSRFTPSSTDRGKLEKLFQQAAAMPEPKLVKAPTPAQRPQKQLAAVAAETSGDPVRLSGQQVASLEPQKNAASITDMSPEGLGNGWVQAPEFDEDHPEELAYRPFPLAPLLTETASAHDPSLAGSLQHPDVAATLDVLDDVGAIAPMRFRPGQQVAQVIWAQQFQGKAVYLDALKEIDQGRLLPGGIENRQVKTSAR
ncbi:MAG: DUF882 domain-containing protein [Hyphomicrobium sp.]